MVWVAFGVPTGAVEHVAAGEIALAIVSGAMVSEIMKGLCGRGPAPHTRATELQRRPFSLIELA